MGAMVGQSSMANSHRHWKHEVVMTMPVILKNSAICVFFRCTVSATDKNTGKKRPLPAIPKIYLGWCAILC